MVADEANFALESRNQAGGVTDFARFREFAARFLSILLFSNGAKTAHLIYLA